MTTAADHPLRAAAPSRTARATVLAAATLTIMAAAIVAPSLPGMRQEYAGVPGADVLVRLALTVTSLAIAVSAPLAGALADRFGRRPLLLAGLLLYAVAGTAALFAADLRLLLGTRILLGLGVGAIMTALSTLITDWFDGPRRASFLGLQQVFASAGGVVFLPLAGVLAAFDWRAPFALYAFALVLVPFAVLAVREPGRTRSVPQQSAERAADAAAAQRLGAAPGPARTAVRVLPMYAFALAATVAFYMAPTQLPFLMSTLGAGSAVTGTLIAASTLTGAAGALAFPALRRRLSGAALLTLSVALLGAGWLLVGAAGALGQIGAGLLVGGAGVGTAVPTLNLRLSELAPPHLRARILSGLVTSVFLGQFLSPLVAQPLIGAAGIAGAFAWTGAAGAFGAGCAAAVLLRRARSAAERR